MADGLRGNIDRPVATFRASSAFGRVVPSVRAQYFNVEFNVASTASKFPFHAIHSAQKYSGPITQQIGRATADRCSYGRRGAGSLRGAARLSNSAQDRADRLRAMLDSQFEDFVSRLNVAPDKTVSVGRIGCHRMAVINQGVIGFGSFSGAVDQALEPAIFKFDPGVHRRSVLTIGVGKPTNCREATTICFSIYTRCTAPRGQACGRARHIPPAAISSSLA